MKKNKNIASVSAPICKAVTCIFFMAGLQKTARSTDVPVEPQSTQVAAPETPDLEVFMGARILTRPSENAYPTSEERDGREGWVRLNMMIDPQGKSYEAMVVDSSGNRALEKAALQSLEKMTFEPARRGETPIDSSYTLKMKFSIRNLAKGASPEFVAAYRSFSNAVLKGNKQRADSELARLRAQNLYEESFANFGKYFYHKQWGTPADQLADLRLAIAGETRAEYLPTDAFTSALGAMFALETAALDLGSALGTWHILEPIAPAEMRASLQPTVDSIRNLQSSARPVTMSARIADSSEWSGTLFRNQFSIAVTSGLINEIKLRCERQYLFFKYEPGLQYSIGSKKGLCGIEVIGNPGTTFNLVQ